MRRGERRYFSGASGNKGEKERTEGANRQRGRQQSSDPRETVGWKASSGRKGERGRAARGREGAGIVRSPSLRRGGKDARGRTGRAAASPDPL